VIFPSRIGGSGVPAALASSASCFATNCTDDARTAHTMFDCPEAIQTSPTRMFVSTTFFPASSVTTISAGVAFAVSGSSDVVHLPSAPAVAVFFWPANSTVIFVPGLLQPHTGTGISRWRMALSANGVPSSIAGAGFGAGAGSAATAKETASHETERARRRFTRGVSAGGNGRVP